MRRRVTELVRQISFPGSLRSQWRLVVGAVSVIVLVALLLVFYNLLLKILVGGVAIAFAACACASWWWLPPYYVRRYHPEIIEPKERADVEDNFRKNVGQFLGGIVVLLGIWKAYVETSQTLSKSEASQALQRKSSTDLLYSQQFGKAFDQLGTVDRSGKAVIITQLGGIYTLEGVMKGSVEYRWRIIEAIAAFIRLKSPLGASSPVGASSIDIITQTALTVLGRRDQSPEEAPINLEQTNLGKANLSGAKLENVILRRSDLTGATLNEARFVSADLSDAILTAATLRRTVLTGAILTDANLSRAILNEAILRSSKLTGANLTDADLTDADLTNADLTNADLTNAILTGARMQGAVLTGANMTGAKYDNQTILPVDVVPATRNMVKIE